MVGFQLLEQVLSRVKKAESGPQSERAATARDAWRKTKGSTAQWASPQSAQGRQVAEGRHEKYPRELWKGARRLGKSREAEAGGP